MVELIKAGDAYILDIGVGEGDDEHRLSPDRIATISAALNEVEQSAGPAALVLTAGGRYWSNGLEVDRLVSGTQDEVVSYVDAYHELICRFLETDIPTVGALQGHAAAGGLLLALALDRRVMRADRGFLVLPEVFLGIPFSDGMVRLVQAKVSPGTAHEAMTTGRRYTGPEALAAGLVEDVVAETLVVRVAVERAQQMAAARGQTYAAIKRSMYPHVVQTLRAFNQEAFIS